MIIERTTSYHLYYRVYKTYYRSKSKPVYHFTIRHPDEQLTMPTDVELDEHNDLVKGKFADKIPNTEFTVENMKLDAELVA